MIPELQLQRVRIEVELVGQIRFPILAHIVVEQGNRDDQRHVVISELVDHLQQFLFLIDLRGGSSSFSIGGVGGRCEGSFVCHRRGNGGRACDGRACDGCCDCW